MRWDGPAARAHGLASHLMPPAELAALGSARDLADIAGRLAAAGYSLPAGPITARGIDRAVRRRIASDLRILVRWASGSGGGLEPVLLDEDRRSLRAVLRGILGGASLDDRVASLVPTVELSASRLAELARQASPGAVAQLLIDWRSQFGWAIGPEASRSRPDLFTLERAIDRSFASRAVALARPGGRPVQRWVARLLDHENAFAALALGRSGPRPDPASMFIDGGERLPLAGFLAAVRAGPDGAPFLLARAFRRTLLARALTAGGDLEEAALADREREQAELARAWPASAAPVLLLVIRRQAEARAIRRALWAVTTGTEVAA